MCRTCPWAHAYISGKALVPVFQLLHVFLLHTGFVCFTGVSGKAGHGQDADTDSIISFCRADTFW